MMTVRAECLSNTKSFKNKMTHLSSYKKFLPGSEMGVRSYAGSLQVPVHGALPSLPLRAKSTADAWPITCFAVSSCVT